MIIMKLAKIAFVYAFVVFGVFVVIFVQNCLESEQKYRIKPICEFAIFVFISQASHTHTQHTKIEIFGKTDIIPLLIEF